jgi:hypothetical protein
VNADVGPRAGGVTDPRRVTAMGAITVPFISPIRANPETPSRSRVFFFTLMILKIFFTNRSLEKLFSYMNLG